VGNPACPVGKAGFLSLSTLVKNFAALKKIWQLFTWNMDFLVLLVYNKYNYIAEINWFLSLYKP